jgi:hypothetical protein
MACCTLTAGAVLLFLFLNVRQNNADGPDTSEHYLV